MKDSDTEELDEDGNIPGLPTIQTIPVQEQEEPEERSEEEVVESFKERWEDAEHGERAKEIYEELGGDSGNEEGAEEAEKAAPAYEEVDESLLEAIKKSSWWVANEYDGELSKSPGIWRKDDSVPEYVRETITEVIESTTWDWVNFESLTIEEANELEDIVEEKLTQPQGWSIESIAEAIRERFGEAKDVATGLAADATHNVLNTAREEAYRDMDGSEDFVYDWIGPDDHRTTPVCRETKEEIEDRGGAVSLPTLKQILRQKAQQYEGTSEGGGTPGRVDNWEPHYQCRHTFVREVQTI